MALNRFENSAEDIAQKAHLQMIDVVLDRPVSLHVAEQINVQHQSPQILLIKQGKAIFNASHNAIDGREIYALLD